MTIASKTIAGRRIASRVIAQRRIATGGAALSEVMHRVYPPGAATFTVPTTGIYEFAGWGPGSNQLGGGYSISGALGVRRVSLVKNQTVAITVGNGDAAYGTGGGSGSNTATSITFPDGSQMIWTDGNNTTGTAATVTGGDVNIPGNASNSAAVAAPSYQNYLGGQPGSGGQPRAPGSGAFTSGIVWGSSGQVEVTLVGPNMKID